MPEYLRFMFSDGGRVALFIAALVATLGAAGAWVKLIDDTNKALVSLQENADKAAAAALSQRRAKQWDVLRSLHEAYFLDHDGLTTSDLIAPPADWVNGFLSEQNASWRVAQKPNGGLEIIDLPASPPP